MSILGSLDAVILGSLSMVVVGIVLGLIGGGGAILTMPILVYLFAVPPTIATSYSLFIVGLVSAIGVWRYQRQGLVDYPTALIFVLPSFLGTWVARHVVLPMIPSVMTITDTYSLTQGGLVMVVFALVMMGASISMIRSKPVSTRQGMHYRVPKLIVLGFTVGAVAGFVGAGGGFLIIPALVMLGGLSMKAAIPTSLFIIALNSLVAFGGDLISGHSMEWPLLAGTSALAIFGLFGGVSLSHRIEAGRLKVGFGWFVMVMGSWLLVKQLLF